MNDRIIIVDYVTHDGERAKVDYGTEKRKGCISEEHENGKIFLVETMRFYMGRNIFETYEIGNDGDIDPKWIPSIECKLKELANGNASLDELLYATKAIIANLGEYAEIGEDLIGSIELDIEE